MTVVAVTGATGYVGRFVVAELQQQGYDVRALARPQTDRDGFAQPPAWVEGDLRDAGSLAAFVHGADAVVHLAYAHVLGRYRGGEGDDLPGWLDANLNGSLRLLQAAQAANVQRFVFLSSRAVFSRTDAGRVLDESHPTSPDTHYGACKVAVEAFLQSFAAARRPDGSAMHCCTVRATGVYGVTWPVERSKWWNLVRAVVQSGERAGEFNAGALTGGGTEVHGADVARVICHWLQQPAPAFDVIHLSDGFVAQREVVRLARAAVGGAGIGSAANSWAGPLPPEQVAPPANPLVCRRLGELGLTLGGPAALQATIAALVRAAQEQNGAPATRP